MPRAFFTPLRAFQEVERDVSESCDVSRLLSEHQASVLRYIQAKGCSKLGQFEEQARQSPCLGAPCLGEIRGWQGQRYTGPISTWREQPVSTRACFAGWACGCTQPAGAHAAPPPGLPLPRQDCVVFQAFEETQLLTFGSDRRRIDWEREWRRQLRRVGGGKPQKGGGWANKIEGEVLGWGGGGGGYGQGRRPGQLVV